MEITIVNSINHQIHKWRPKDLQGPMYNKDCCGEKNIEKKEL